MRPIFSAITVLLFASAAMFADSITVTLDTTGSVSSPSSTTGGVTVNSSPFSVVMTDNSFFNEAQLPYTPGASLTFEATYTTNVDDPAPDSFTFAIFDGSGNETQTTNSNSNNSFLEVDLPTSTFRTVIMSSGSSDGLIPAPIVVPGGVPISTDCRRCSGSPAFVQALASLASRQKELYRPAAGQLKAFAIELPRLPERLRKSLRFERRLDRRWPDPCQSKRHRSLEG